MAFDQDSFRARNDDGGESAATWIAAANTDWTQAANTNFRVRFLIQETAGSPAANQDFKLQYDHQSSGTWTDVTGSSSVVKAKGSSFITDQGDTTQQVGAGTFVTDNDGLEDLDGAVPAVADFAGSDETELEFCLQLVASDLEDGEEVQIRVVEGDGTAFAAYTNTPTITTSIVSSKYSHVARTINQPMGIQTWNRIGVSIDDTVAALLKKHLPDGRHDDPNVARAVGHVSMRGTTPILDFGYGVRGVVRTGEGRYSLAFNLPRGTSRTVKLVATPDDGFAVPVARTSDGSITLELHTHRTAFDVYLGSNQNTITQSTYVKVQFDTETIDRPGNNFDSASGYDFTAPDPGLYEFSTVVEAEDSATEDSFTAADISIHKNGSSLVNKSMAKTIGDASHVEGEIKTGAVSLAAGDTIDVRINVTNSANNCNIISGSAVTWFRGNRVDGVELVDRGFSFVLFAN